MVISTIIGGSEALTNEILFIYIYIDFKAIMRFVQGEGFSARIIPQPCQNFFNPSWIVIENGFVIVLS